ncbi:hypothetical protein ACET3Z_031900 [Daucus carota]
MERDLGSKSRHQRPSNDKKSGSATSYARVFVGDADRGGVMSGGMCLAFLDSSKQVIILGHIYASGQIVYKKLKERPDQYFGRGLVRIEDSQEKIGGADDVFVGDIRGMLIALSFSDSTDGIYRDKK